MRRAEEIYQAEGEIENGTFHGRWHFSFGDYYDPRYERFGTLRVSNDDGGSLPIASDAKVYSCFLEQGQTVTHPFPADHGGYLYVVGGGDVVVAGESLRALDAAMLRPDGALVIQAQGDAELLLVVVPLGWSNRVGRAHQLSATP